VVTKPGALSFMTATFDGTNEWGVRITDASSSQLRNRVYALASVIRQHLCPARRRSSRDQSFLLFRPPSALSGLPLTSVPAGGQRGGRRSV
jgi:hypothetical protein